LFRANQSYLPIEGEEPRAVETESSMSGTSTNEPSWLDRKRKISVREAAALNDVCEDTFRQRYSHLIKKISPRRHAVVLGDALDVGDPKTAA
jgi:hypothetical protein